MFRVLGGSLGPCYYYFFYANKPGQMLAGAVGRRSAAKVRCFNMCCLHCRSRSTACNRNGYRQQGATVPLHYQAQSPRMPGEGCGLGVARFSLTSKAPGLGRALGREGVPGVPPPAFGAVVGKGEVELSGCPLPSPGLRWPQTNPSSRGLKQGFP